jgi:hypothetical protein
VKSRNSSHSDDEDKAKRTFGFHLYARQKELPYMRFDSPLEETESKVHEMWDDVAFVVCSKNTNDMKDLMDRVQKYKHTTFNAP